MRLVFLGGPGSGKGTQGVLLARKLGVVHLSTGALLREALKSPVETPLKTAAAVIASGALVPDDVMNALVAGHLTGLSGWVLDGFPRTLVQAEALERIAAPEAAIFLDVSERELLLRLTGRRVCGACGADWHLAYKPPRHEEVCDGCGGELRARPEDELPERVALRLSLYREQAAPLLALYRERGRLVSVSGEGSVESVHQRICAALEVAI